MPKTVLGCIADDYSGATDLAGLLARSGIAVSLRFGVPDNNPDPADTAEIEVIALKCRNSAADQAVAECLEALTWLKNAGATKFYWKYCSTFDSTAKGNICPVAEALMASLGTDQTIYCPAFPENGRSVYMGNLFVGEQPIAESPMKDHPLTPMRDGNLMRLLSPQVKRRVGLANRAQVAGGVDRLQARLNALREQSVAHVIVDAVSDSDLFTIAQACVDFPLLTGGSALAMSLPQLYAHAGLMPQTSVKIPRPSLPNGQIVLSGSCSAMTRKQVAAYIETASGYFLDPLDLYENGTRQVRQWLSEQKPDTAKIIYATAGPDLVRKAQDALGAARAGALIESALAQLAIDARNMGVVRFVVAGGETSGAVANALGVRHLNIGSEIVPGVPWTYSVSDGVDIALALKSGNFGETDFFSKSLAILEAE